MMVYSLMLEYPDNKIKVYNCDSLKGTQEVYGHERAKGLKKAFMMRTEMSEYKKELGLNKDYLMGNFGSLDAVIFEVLNK